MFSFKDGNQKRTLESLGKKFFLNPKNYFIPQTIDDFKSVKLFDSRLTVNSSDWYFNESTKAKFNDFIKLIYSIDDINRTVSFDTVYGSVKIELETEIELKGQQRELRVFDDVLNTIFNRISKSRKEYDFYFPIEGIELRNIDTIELKSVQLISFEENLKNTILFSTNVNDSTKEHIEKFINENLLAHLCIKCSFFGDYKKAQEEAKFRARETLNYFRYVICLLKYERIYEELIKIRFLSEAYIGRDEFLAKNQEDDSVILEWGRGRSNFENFVIDEPRLQELEEKGFLNEFAEIINGNQNNRTKLEGCILSAIYWAGEAQNEYDWDIAFLKFWTALEGIFSYNKDEPVRQTLARGVSITVAALGGYQFIEICEIKQVKKEIIKLYDERCRIVHGGVRRRIKSSQLIEICKYTTWTVLSLLSLRSMGCETIEEIDIEVRRIDNMIFSTNSSAQPQVNLCDKVPLSWQRYWETEAKRTGTTITSVVIEALKARFGEPNQLENQISEDLETKHHHAES